MSLIIEGWGGGTVILGVHEPVIKYRYCQLGRVGLLLTKRRLTRLIDIPLLMRLRAPSSAQKVLLRHTQ